VETQLRVYVLWLRPRQWFDRHRILCINDELPRRRIESQTSNYNSTAGQADIHSWRFARYNQLNCTFTLYTTPEHRDRTDYKYCCKARAQSQPGNRNVSVLCISSRWGRWLCSKLGYTNIHNREPYGQIVFIIDIAKLIYSQCSFHHSGSTIRRHSKTIP